MDVNSITPTSQTPLGNSATDTSSAAVLSSDFETFLQMLTAQVRYQDPLEPIASSEFAAQLAQFSGVEQQVLTNELLGDMSDRLGTSNMAQISGWIGMEARTTAPVYFDGDSITLDLNPNVGAEQVNLVAYDQAGEVILRTPIEKTTGPFDWDGVALNGTELPAGVYGFDLENIVQGEVTETTAVPTYSNVREARLEGNQTILLLAGDVAISASDVIGIRQPS